MEEMKTTIVSIADTKGYELGDQETKTSRNIKDLFQSSNMRVHHAVFQPGYRSSKHSHPNSEEIVYIVKGQGELDTDVEVMLYGPETIIFVPPGTPHSFRNVGEDEMILIAIYSPPTDLPQK